MAIRDSHRPKVDSYKGFKLVDKRMRRVIISTRLKRNDESPLRVDMGNPGLNVINTVGCGDAFVGAFAAYYALGADFQRSLIMASAAAGLNAIRPETRGSPERAILEATEQKCRNLGFIVREYRRSKNC